jgi:hypothetical protein
VTQGNDTNRLSAESESSWWGGLPEKGRVKAMVAPGGSSLVRPLAGIMGAMNAIT